MLTTRGRATMIALGLLFPGLVPPAAAQQDRPLGVEVRERERERTYAPSRMHGDTAHGLRVYRHGAADSAHARFLYRASLSTRCARMGISFMGDDTIRVHEVLPGSGAAEAGVEQGDIIVSVQGERANQRTMTALADNLEAGDRVRIVVDRSGRRHTLDVTARAYECPYRTMISEAPLRMMCMTDDSASAANAEECEGVSIYHLRRELAALERDIPWRVMTESADSGVWLRFRDRDGPGDSIFFDLDSVRVMGRAVLMHMDSLGTMMPFALDSIAGLMPRIHLEIDGAMENAHAGAVMLRSMELGSRALAGAQLTPLNPDLAEYFETERGVLITTVEPNTPAARVGLQGGDVIIAVDGAEVDGLEDVRRLVHGAEGTIRLTILRRGERRTVDLSR